MVRFVSILPILCLAGCAWTSPRTVTRTWLDRNTYRSPSLICERIDVRPMKAYRVADYRWRHVRNPTGVVTVVEMPFVAGVPVEESAEPGSETAVPPGVPATPVPSPPPAPVSPMPVEPVRKPVEPGVSSNQPRTLSSGDSRTVGNDPDDSRADQDRVRTSWLFDGTTVR